MLPQDLRDKKLLLFGGKGGVGKTTCAAATSIALHPKKTLLASLDPAHSLSDCLDQQLGHEPRRVKGISHLSAVELDPYRTLDEFKQVYRRAILRVLETSAGFQYLTSREREGLLSLPIPGAEEVLLLRKVLDMMQEGTYEAYVLDTAPTAHALRILSMPEVFDSWVGIFHGLRRKRRQEGAAFHQPDYADQFLQTMKDTAAQLRQVLRPPDTEFVVVASAEHLAVEETADLVRTLRASRVPISRIVVNKLFPESETEFARVRREQERVALSRLARELPDLQIHTVSLEAHEPRGVERLARFGRRLYRVNSTL